MMEQENKPQEQDTQRTPSQEEQQQTNSPNDSAEKPENASAPIGDIPPQEDLMPDVSAQANQETAASTTDTEDEAGDIPPHSAASQQKVSTDNAATTQPTEAEVSEQPSATDEQSESPQEETNREGETELGDPLPVEGEASFPVEETPASVSSDQDESGVTSERAEAEEEEEPEPEIDWENASMEELTGHVEAALNAPENRRLYERAKKARIEVNRRQKADYQEALAKHKEEAGEDVEFQHEPKEEYNTFFNTFKTLSQARRDFTEGLAKSREKNLVEKRDVLERLKALSANVDQPDAYDQFRALQQEWKSIGPVPSAGRDNLNEEYRFAIKLFFDQRDLLHEMRDLDRQKNLSAREEIVRKIEQLYEYEDVREAVNQMRQLQQDYRQTGPVPKEAIEPIKERYKQACIRLFEKREKLNEELQQQRDQNYQAKQEILEHLRTLIDFSSEEANDWIKRNDEIGQWIERWRAIGPVPASRRDEQKEAFSEVIRIFNKNKNDFFKNRKKERVDNLNQKRELIDQAKKFLEVENPQEHRKAMIRLQDEWKKTGPVPRKYSEKMWQEFQKTCDAFFQKLNAQRSDERREQEDNLSKKQELVERIKQVSEQEEIENLEETIRNFQNEWSSIGYVPFKKKDDIRNAYFEALNKLIDRSKAARAESNQMRYQLRLQTMSNEGGGGGGRGRDDRGRGRDRDGGGSPLQQEERKLQRDLKNIENEISTLENNMEFFRNSKNADALKRNIEQQVEQLRARMEELQEKIRLVREMHSQGR